MKLLTTEQADRLRALYTAVRNVLPENDRSVHGMAIALPRSASPELRAFFTQLSADLVVVFQSALKYPELAASVATAERRAAEAEEDAERLAVVVNATISAYASHQ